MQDSHRNISSSSILKMRCQGSELKIKDSKVKSHQAFRALLSAGSLFWRQTNQLAFALCHFNTQCHRICNITLIDDFISGAQGLGAKEHLRIPTTWKWNSSPSIYFTYVDLSAKNIPVHIKHLCTFLEHKCTFLCTD